MQPTLAGTSTRSRTLSGRRWTSLLGRLPTALTLSCRQLLHIVLFRYLIAAIRYFWFVVVRRRLRVIQGSAAVAPITIRHNLLGMIDLAVARSETLIRPLSVIDRVAQDISELRVLSVGPRTEGELLNLVAYGFRWKNIRGLDLISYSPSIDLGDMHAMPYRDRSFDVIVLGWVMAYSLDCQKAASEVIRVAKDGAVIAVGIVHNPLSDAEVEQRIGYAFGAYTRITCVDQILEWFAPAVDVVYVRHDIPPDRRDRLGAIYTLFSLRHHSST